MAYYPESVIAKTIKLLDYFYGTRDRKLDGMRGFNKKCDAGSAASLLKYYKSKKNDARPNTIQKKVDRDNRQIPLFGDL